MTETIVVDTSRLDRFVAQLNQELPQRLRTGALRAMLRAYRRRASRMLASTGASRRAQKAARAVLGVRVNQRQAKVGFGVRKNTKKEKGITHRNVHWLVLGTGKRKTNAGANRGQMPALFRGVLQRAAAAAQAEAVREARRWLIKEIRKMRSKL